MNKTFKQFVEGAYAFAEGGLTPEEKKNAKLKYQYDQRNNPQPKKPLDILKSKKGLV